MGEPIYKWENQWEKPAKKGKKGKTSMGKSIPKYDVFPT